MLALPFKDGVKRQDRVNARVRYIEGDFTDEEKVRWNAQFKEVPEPLTEQDKQDFLKGSKGVAISSDAFFPFRDSIDHASKLGVSVSCCCSSIFFLCVPFFSATSRKANLKLSAFLVLLTISQSFNNGNDNSTSLNQAAVSKMDKLRKLATNTVSLCASLVSVYFIIRGNDVVEVGSS